MAAITKEILDSILPIVVKDQQAKRDLKLYREGKGRFETAKSRVRYHAWRIVNDRETNLTRQERLTLLEFVARFPPGPNAGRSDNPMMEQLAFRVTADEKVAITKAAEKAEKATGESRSEWLRRAALLLLKMEAGEVGIHTSGN